MRKLFFIASILLLATTSCKKNHDRTVHGQIVDSTNSNQPIATTSFSLHVLTTDKGKVIEVPYAFVTDASGKFNVSFSANDDEGFGIVFPGGTLVHSPGTTTAIWATDINGKTDFDAGIIKTKLP